MITYATTAITMVHEGNRLTAPYWRWLGATELHYCVSVLVQLPAQITATQLRGFEPIVRVSHVMKVVAVVYMMCFAFVHQDDSQNLQGPTA